MSTVENLRSDTNTMGDSSDYILQVILDIPSYTLQNAVFHFGDRSVSCLTLIIANLRWIFHRGGVSVSHKRDI